MNRIKSKVKILLIIIIPIIFSGCWDQKPFEKIGFINIVGIEASKDGRMKLTYGMPVIDPTAQKRDELIESTSSLVREGRDNIRRISSKTAEAGAIQLALYSKELAEKGYIHEINEIFERDPSNPALAWVAVVDGSPDELIRKADTFKDKSRPSIYITELLERGVQNGFTCETRAFRYDITYYAPGIDNIAPLIKLNPDGVLLEGSALFSRGKMVGAINQRQNALLMAMMGKLKNTSYTFFTSGAPDSKEGPKQGIAVLIRQKSRKINISIQDNKPVVDIYLSLYGQLDEYEWNDFTQEKNLNIVKDYVQNQIERDCQSLTSYMQEVDSDPIGIGDMIRAKHNSVWKSADWHNVYPDAKISVHVDLNIAQYGAIQ